MQTTTFLHIDRDAHVIARAEHTETRTESYPVVVVQGGGQSVTLFPADPETARRLAAALIQAADETEAVWASRKG